METESRPTWKMYDDVLKERSVLLVQEARLAASLARVVAFLDESMINVADDPTPLYAGGMDLQEVGKQLCANDFKEAVRQAKALVEAHTKECCDCHKKTIAVTLAAIHSSRCDKCQVERDEYYNEKLRAEHGPARRDDSFRPHEHSTYIGKP